MSKFKIEDHVEFQVNRRGHGKKVGVIEDIKRHRTGVNVYKIAVFDKARGTTEFWRVPETDTGLKATTIAKGSDAAQKIQKAVKDRDEKKVAADQKKWDFYTQVAKLGIKKTKVKINYKGGPRWETITGFNRNGVYPSSMVFRKKSVAWRFILDVAENKES